MSEPTSSYLRRPTRIRTLNPCDNLNHGGPVLSRLEAAALEKLAEHCEDVRWACIAALDVFDLDAEAEAETVEDDGDCESDAPIWGGCAA